MKKRKILEATLVLLVTLMSLVGCSRTPTVKSNSEIMDELSKTNCYSETYPEFTINDIEIVKRQTDAESKTDKVYATLSVINEDESVGGYIDMMVLYALYNDGWVLDDCEVDFSGTNNGNYFYPLKGAELSLEGISSALTALTGETFTDVAVYATETDLENGMEVYSVTGTASHTYMTGKIDATLTNSFSNSGGYWEAPILETNSYEEDWHIAGDYYLTDEDGFVRTNWGGNWGIKCLTIIDNYPADFISVKYTNTGSDWASNETGEAMYDAQLITPQSLLLGALKTWGYRDYEYIDDYGFPVKIEGDYSSIYPFEYVTYWCSDKNHCNGILYIGKDNLAYSGEANYEVDDYYNRRIVLDIWDLVPVE